MCIGFYSQGTILLDGLYKYSSPGGFKGKVAECGGVDGINIPRFLYLQVLLISVLLLLCVCWTCELLYLPFSFHSELTWKCMCRELGWEKYGASGTV